MKRRSFLPLGIGLIVLALGLLFTQASLIALAIPLVMYSCIHSISSFGLEAPVIRVSRTISKHRAAEEEEIDIRLTLVSDQANRKVRIAISDLFPNIADLVDGTPGFFGKIAPGETLDLNYRLSLPRGWHSFDGVSLTVWSSWSIASKSDVLKEADNVIVHPRTERLAPIPIHPRRTRAFAGSIRANLGGQGMDFFGCRSYVPGDDIRRINWRAYARQDTLIINEYELERIADVSVVVDARLMAHSQLEFDTTFDHCARAAGSLSQSFLDRGNIVGLLVYGNYLQWVFPGTGRSQQQRILDSLAKSEPAEKAVFEDLRKLPTRLFPAQSQIVLISPLVDEDDVEVVSILVDRGYSLLLICPHAGHWQDTQLGDAAPSRLAKRMTRLQREIFLATLIRTGTQVVDWDVAEPISVAIEHALGNPYARRQS